MYSLACSKNICVGRCTVPCCIISNGEQLEKLACLLMGAITNPMYQLWIIVQQLKWIWRPVDAIRGRFQRFSERRKSGCRRMCAACDWSKKKKKIPLPSPISVEILVLTINLQSTVRLTAVVTLRKMGGGHRNLQDLLCHYISYASDYWILSLRF